MHSNHLFEYAVIRMVPKVEREEFLNVGIILYCRDLDFLQTVYRIDEHKVKAFCEEDCLNELEKNLAAFRSIAAGENKNSPIAKLDIASRFRWLTATRSTILQTSKVHPGFCEEPKVIMEKLFVQYVL
jgi:hypothetical protein